MGCAESKDGDRNAGRPKYRSCTDTFWLAIYVLFWLFLIVIAIFAFVYGNPLRIINGYDTFGNTCGVKQNERIFNSPLSGLDTHDKPDVFYFDVKELKKSLKICVKQCPTKTLTQRNELVQYYRDTGTQLCRYDFDMTQITSAALANDNSFFNYLGPCPSFPVQESSPVLHRCVPKGKSAQVKDMYDMLNSWDVAQQFLGDIYTTWHIIAAICGISLLISIALVTLMHWLSRIVSWLICVLVIVASIGLTGTLWYAYYSIRHNGASTQYTQLEEFIRNEQAVFTLAILATITMIILLIIIYYLKNKLSGLSALFEEAGECMMSLPGLLIAPILAFIVLAAFLAFWVVVVICLATATTPDQSPFAPFDNSGNHQLTNAVNNNNTQNDFKIMRSF
ncbi:CTL-like protein 1 isoform X2 [Scaptodrosophila lebanonensis]|uniref:Choline transporter-like protein n=1 Tax=Drosophila lebanonensis TaxID=7225 RepID=A0A6J2TJ32_DROLE|nr:CTL-like protein 1 isoform X2 [Scaptodrosophila lebanonensis]